MYLLQNRSKNHLNRICIYIYILHTYSHGATSGGGQKKLFKLSPLPLLGYVSVSHTTHQTAPGIGKQIIQFIAEDGGEDGEICICQLLKIGSATGLWHQRVTVERRRVSS